jgi:hypothetical protein
MCHTKLSVQLWEGRWNRYQAWTFSLNIPQMPSTGDQSFKIITIKGRLLYFSGRMWTHKCETFTQLPEIHVEQQRALPASAVIQESFICNVYNLLAYQCHNAWTDLTWVVHGTSAWMTEWFTAGSQITSLNSNTFKWLHIYFRFPWYTWKFM